MFKKVISIILSIMVLSGGIIMMTACEKTDRTLTLKFVSDPINSDNGTTQTYTLNYNESCFDTSPKQFSEQIARISMVLSAAAYSSASLLDDLKIMGFEKNAKFNYGGIIDPTAVGVVMASQKIGDTTLLAIVLRGTSGDEWYSNFDIGEDISSTKVHNGFDVAAQFALKKLDMYMVNYGIDRDHTKFLVTGHSRGGAVANLMGASLIDKYGSDSVYAYTFASPNPTTSTTADSAKYSGIFNFVNPEDFIAYVPIKQWGFTKYGTTISFASNGDTTYESQLSSVKSDFKKYTSRNYQNFGSDQKLNKFIDKIYELAPTVNDYYNKKYDIMGTKMSIYDYMMCVAHLINEKDVMANGLVMLSSSNSQLSELTDYFMSGIDMVSSGFSIDYENSLIAYAHTGETYLAWLDAYIAHM